MKIEITHAGIVLQIGEPSVGHLRIKSVVKEQAIEIAFADWELLKTKVDKMFEAAKVLK